MNTTPAHETRAQTQAIDLVGDDFGEADGGAAVGEALGTFLDIEQGFAASQATA